MNDLVSHPRPCRLPCLLEACRQTYRPLCGPGKTASRPCVGASTTLQLTGQHSGQTSIYICVMLWKFAGDSRWLLHRSAPEAHQPIGMTGDDLSRGAKGSQSKAAKQRDSILSFLLDQVMRRTRNNLACLFISRPRVCVDDSTATPVIRHGPFGAVGTSLGICGCPCHPQHPRRSSSITQLPLSEPLRPLPSLIRRSDTTTSPRSAQ
ncbi:hypothetical protein LY76DRAFT_278550 [Colletotrichum caudatum]|nr:hypothetical protein LY76DRAFT_278550 [Colletotrichum caudatum]